MSAKKNGPGIRARLGLIKAESYGQSNNQSNNQSNAESQLRGLPFSSTTKAVVPSGNC